jgi:hypothetical protein
MAGFSQQELVNMALDHLGARAMLQDENQTQEARVSGRHYPFVFKALLSRHPWRWASKKTVLSPLVEPTGNGFSHKYHLPGDYLRLVAISHPFHSYPHLEDDIKFAIEKPFLYAEFAPLGLTYIPESILEQPDRMPPLFAEAFIYALAASMARVFLDKATAMTDLKTEAQRSYLQAVYQDSLEGTPPHMGAPDMYRTRGAGGNFPTDWQMSNMRINLP